ncbi:erythromycin esterase family protein [uncultured Proteiniphilum sp.]|uniref:erythromycin esterase family protein n=1 Tax=uncultured Proteiniphilum sp. TaxID=497637 RepID=UPI00261AAF84|nr:erythromycin esterase family protein [uncultured Proteiniphilum sp.]
MNLDFEFKNPGSHLPKHWYTGGESFKISVDSLEKHSGKFSLKMETPGTRNNNSFGVFTGTLPIETFAGKNVEYRGWIKTKNVKNGYAGLWLRVDGENTETLGFDNMNDRGLTGDNDWTQVSIKIDISREAININYGGLFPGEGVVWFDNLELYVNGEKFIEPKLKTTLSRKEKKVIKEYIYPLRTYEPDSGNTKDLEILEKLIGNSKVVALGEVSHGSSEIFKMKNRIIQYLAANSGFDIFSIEANMPESYKLNDYTVHGKGDPKKLIAGMYFWTWRTVEVLNMVEWMRRFNHPEKRIEFTGFDMQFYEGAVKELMDAFEEDEIVRNKIADLGKILNEIKSRTQQNRELVSADDNEMKEIDSLISFIQNSIETSSFQTSDKQWLQQNMVIIRQYLGSINYAWRDKCMADNVMWIKENNPDSKLVIWAHNGHIQKTSKMMGYHLARQLDDDYITFGFTFYDGSFTAVGNKGLTFYEASRVYPGTLEYLLDKLNEPVFILDLKKIRSDNKKDTEWLLERLAYRSVGALGGSQYEFQNRIVSDDFDYLIFIRTSTPSLLFPDTR